VHKEREKERVNGSCVEGGGSRGSGGNAK
jgi:hypothetical protein